ncbi:MAG TPA: CRTAC1 family protein [Chthonomonadaceae bacterium]|nr:CRTAC1 family protein [Chthonomonadaceae bacterium]
MKALLITTPVRIGLITLLLLGGIGLLLILRLRPTAQPTWGAPPHKSGSMDPATGAYLGEGTKRMAARLQAMADTRDPWRDNFALSAQRIQSLQGRIAEAKTPNIRLSLTGELADELLNAGQTEDALKTYGDYQQIALKNYPAFYEKGLKYMTEKRIAMCYLRLGEQQNCCANNNTDSCLLPIQGGGIHTKQFGSREGVKRLMRVLEWNPDDMGARWSLNIAYMTLGQYPEFVPAKWLIPPRVFQSEAAIPRFPNLAPQKGLALDGLAGGCVIEDFDGDGWLDLMVARCGVHDQLRFFHNNGDGTFTERTREAGLTGEVGGINLIQGDYNNDGYMDVLVLRGGGMPPSLLRNNGDGTFDDVTEEAGLRLADSSRTAVWFDYNGDGYLDLFVGGTESRPCALYRNNGDGTFTECAAEAGLALKGSFQSVISLDYNNDGRPDLFLTRLGLPNMLLRNDGPRGLFTNARSAWRFTDVSVASGLATAMQSLSCVAFDYDNDGWDDIFVPGASTNGPTSVAYDYLGLGTIGTPSKLYRNRHDGTFEDVSHSAHLDKVLMGQAVNYGDIDNDGNLDLYVGTGGPALSDLVPKRMFRNADGKFFQDVTTAGDFGHLQKGNAISFGDLRNNGQQDIYEVMGGVYAGDVAHNTLYMNPGNRNHWITLQLEGVRTNRAAIGARIKVTLERTDGPRVLYRTVRSGGSWGASPLRQEIGLGQATAIRTVEITWPVTGKTQILTGLQMNRLYKIREGVPQPIP